MNEIEINNYFKEIYQQNKDRGWWDDPNRDFLQTAQLVNTEISEATEGDRKNLDDEHLSHRKSAEVELADAFIRICDLSGRYNWGYLSNLSEIDFYNFFDEEFDKIETLAGKHLLLSLEWSYFALGYYQDVFIESEDINKELSAVVDLILKIAETENYDLKGAVDEKLEYNKIRVDHDRDHRASAGGKKY